jgi:hypothetical protein
MSRITQYASRITKHASRITQHASRIILTTLGWLTLHAALAAPVAAQLQPLPTQPLLGVAFIDLNTNGQRDHGEPARPGVLIEARHINSEITKVWRDTTDQYGDYHLLLWDPGHYHLTAHCTEQTGQLSSITICWQSPSPLIINGSGRAQNIPLPPRRLYLPINRTP